MILSNKGILPILWELNPRHPNLLEASFDPGHFRDNYVSKPLLSREGANVIIHRSGTVQEQDGSYGGKGTVYQELAADPRLQRQLPGDRFMDDLWRTGRNRHSRRYRAGHHQRQSLCTAPV